MRSAILSTVFAAAAIAAPVVERQAADGGPPDGVILNYALTLEHLENAFYQEGIARFSQADFAAAGLDNIFYANLLRLQEDEQIHVDVLSAQLSAAGVTPVVANEYDFGIDGIPTFLAIANVLEGVGVSAYLGAAQFVDDAFFLTAAGSILAVEARHSSYLRASQQPAQAGFPAPFDIPLSFRSVVTLAGPFITALNPANPPLPVDPFTGLAAAPGAAAIGDSITLTAAEDVEAVAAYFITLTGSVSAPIEGSGTTYTITVPEGTPAGQGYVVLTSSVVADGGAVSDDVIVAGPAIVQIADALAGVIPDPKKCVDGKPEAPKYGKPDAPKKPETPKAPEAPKYEHKPEAPKKPETPKAPEAPKYEHKPEAPKKDEHKATTTTDCPPEATPYY